MKAMVFQKPQTYLAAEGREPLRPLGVREQVHVGVHAGCMLFLGNND